MGIGMAEVFVIVVVAFLALGPSKSIDMARSASKIVRDLRRTFNEITAAVTLDDDDESASSNRSGNRPVNRSGNRPGSRPRPDTRAPRKDPPAADQS